jgi:DNA-binding response OmpR family regulator
MLMSQTTILVVDDDPKQLRLMEALLQPRGYTVVGTPDGAEALDQVYRVQPDLILLDVMLPHMDGWEVCKLLKDHPATRLIPVVMLTALDSMADRIKGIDAGADDVLTKPVYRDELLARIRTSLRLKRAIDATLASLRPEPPPPSSEAHDAVFRPEGDYWTLAYQGTICRLKDLKGLHYLAVLLARPGEAHHVGELVTAVDHPQGLPATPPSDALSATQLATQHLRIDGLGDAGPALDPQAKAAYKRRLEELQVEVAAAQRWHDPARATTAQAEIEFLTDELAAAVGLGGRDRCVASSAQRARLMVTKAIRAALHKIRDHHSALGHHLATSITTGTFCTYTPDPHAPLAWRL